MLADYPLPRMVKKIVALTDYNAVVWDLEADSINECDMTDDSLWAMAFDANNNQIYVGGDAGKVQKYDINCKSIN